MDLIIEIIEGKYRKEYARKYGTEKLMGAFDSAHWKDEEGERIYKHCLDNNITWQEYKGAAPDGTIK